MPRSGMFRFFRSNEVVCCVFFSFFFFWVVHHQSLRLSHTHNCADRHSARIHRAASDMLLVTWKWRYCCCFWALHGVSGTNDSRHGESVLARAYNAPNLVAEHLGASSRASPPPGTRRPVDGVRKRPAKRAKNLFPTRHRHKVRNSRRAATVGSRLSPPRMQLWSLHD